MVDRGLCVFLWHRLRPGASCSPSQGPCCGRDCSYSRGQLCRDDNGCREDTFCDGQGVQCPQSNMKPNKTVCNEEFVCFQVVSGSGGGLV